MDIGNDSSSSSSRARIGPYTLSHTLGEGSCGKVKLAINEQTGEEVAIKIIAKSEFDANPDLKQKVQREIALMRIVSHPGILRLVDVLESQRHFYIVLEYAEQGELFDYLVSNRFLPPDAAMEFFRQIVFTVEYLHSLGICHRDLKPENVLLDSCTRVKLADFGFARWVRASLTDTACGSPHYAAPEIIRGQHYDGKIADIWSLGVILFALLAGYLPFDDTSIRSLLLKVVKGKFQMPLFPPAIQDLIRRMLTVDVSERITIAGIKAHPAFRLNVSASYVFPEPIPMPLLARPVDVDALPAEALDTLLQIGFTDEELRAQLQDTKETDAKLFLSMISKSLDLEALPWDAAFSGPPRPRVSAEAVADSAQEEEAHAGAARVKTFTKEHRKLNPISSAETFSLANRPEWAMQETPVTEVFAEMSCETYNQTMWNLMAKIQVFLGDKPYQWFHPDPNTMFIRKDDASFYVSVVGSFRASTDVTITVRLHKGENKDFVDVVNEIFRVLQK